MCKNLFCSGVWDVMKNNVIRNALVGSVLFVLTACNTTPDDRVCPQAAVIRDLAQLADFGREEKPSPKNLVMAARLDDVRGDCSFRPDRTVVDLDLDLRAYRGPGLGGSRGDLPYFVALTDGTRIISKNNFTATLELGTAEKPATHIETLRITLPAVHQGVQPNWRILVGFQLSPEQVAYNRGDVGEPKPLASPATPVKRVTTK